MTEANGILHRMQEEAIKELCNGKTNWRECNPNTLVLACFGLFSQYLTDKLSKPLWFFAGSVSAGVTWFIVSSIFGLR